MTPRSRIWRVIASLFTVANLAFAGFAIVGGEWMHGAAHVALALVGAYFMKRLAPSSSSQDASMESDADERLERLQHSLDAVALEVERIGEAQRFHTKLQAEQAQSRH